MNIHEYQGKALLKSFGVPVPRGFAAFTAEEAVDAAAKLGGQVWAVKSQIHAGGRGKGKFKEPNAGEKGGVRIAFKPEDVGLYASQMLGNTLVTLQTGAAGRVVKRLYIEEGVKIAKEFYLSALVDRGTGRVAFVASEAGGMNIEEVAHDTPEKITNVPIDPMTGEAEWGLRSVQDDWDSTSWGGENVYDVYSLSEGVGLNKIPYSEW